MSVLHRTRHDDHRNDDTAIQEHPAEAVETERRDTSTTNKHETVKKSRERTWTFAPGQLISLIVGIGAIALGVTAMVRAGIDGSFAEPVVEVLGFTHTAWLGLAEVGAGLLLVLAGTGAWGRPLSVVLGAGMMIAGVLIGAETSAMPEELGLEEAFGWWMVLVGGIVALASMTLPVWRSHRVWVDGEAVDRDRSPIAAH
jgi:hypothetical protein